MKKSLIALLAITFAVVPVLGNVASAETINAAKPDKTYKVKFLKPSESKFALEQTEKLKTKTPFKYVGPRDAFFINGIN